jgi:hypothetical protein
MLCGEASDYRFPYALDGASHHANHYAHDRAAASLDRYCRGVRGGLPDAGSSACRCADAFASYRTYLDWNGN